MDVPRLTTATQTLYRGEPEWLLFCPQEEHIIDCEALRNISRYLFRVATFVENQVSWGE